MSATAGQTTKSDEKKEKPSEQVDAPTSAMPKTATVKADVKKVAKRSPVLNAPKVCPPGYRMDANGKCRKIL